MLWVLDGGDFVTFLFPFSKRFFLQLNLQKKQARIYY